MFLYSLQVCAFNDELQKTTIQKNVKTNNKRIGKIICIKINSIAIIDKQFSL